MKRRLQHFAARVGVKEKRPKLVTEPKGAISGPLHRFDVEVSAGQDALVRKLFRNRERNPHVRITQFEETEYADRTRAAVLCFEVWTDAIDAQMKISGILERAEAVVGHHVEGSVAVVLNGG